MRWDFNQIHIRKMLQSHRRCLQFWAMLRLLLFQLQSSLLEQFIIQGWVAFSTLIMMLIIFFMTILKWPSGRFYFIFSIFFFFLSLSNFLLLYVFLLSISPSLMAHCTFCHNLWCIHILRPRYVKWILKRLWCVIISHKTIIFPFVINTIFSSQKHVQIHFKKKPHSSLRNKIK